MTPGLQQARTHDRERTSRIRRVTSCHIPSVVMGFRDRYLSCLLADPTALHGSDDDSYPRPRSRRTLVENHLRADSEPSGFGASADVPNPTVEKIVTAKVQTISR